MAISTWTPRHRKGELQCIPSADSEYWGIADHYKHALWSARYSQSHLDALRIKTLHYHKAQWHQHHPYNQGYERCRLSTDRIMLHCIAPFSIASKHRKQPRSERRTSMWTIWTVCRFYKIWVILSLRTLTNTGHQWSWCCMGCIQRHSRQYY